ncbi:hypothetical protein OTK49_28405 [Vibrio coralliirubri]|uniref:hypothetical protein n=1 Tax=Vibrio coralliirubri TaxID=1516159 RepID=UPI002285187D|nr:hypothetical protein [Vibrio coralliirubri]MCY9866466.1 hypothetical protein [Vibrio coralliirubri]
MKKIFARNIKTVFVFKKHYGKSAEHVKGLIEAIKADHPFLVDSDINIGIFGGQRYAGVIYVHAVVEQPLETYLSIADRNHLDL